MSVRAKRGTLTQINAAATANALQIGELLYITNENRFAVATAANAFVKLDPPPALATQAEAEAGANNTKVMTPLRTAQAIAALAGDVVKETFTASGTFTKEDDDLLYLVECIGGGGGGRGLTQSTTTAAPGGGGGGYNFRFILAEEITPTVTVEVGSGGNGTPSGLNGDNSQPGGDSSFGAFVTGRGGAGVLVGTPAAGGGFEAAGVSGFFSGGGSLSANGANGGNSICGGAGGGNASGNGGTSVRAGNGGNGNNTSNTKGGNGQAPGGGGGGSGNNGGGGDGARGEVYVTRFKRIKQ